MKKIMLIIITFLSFQFFLAGTGMAQVIKGYGDLEYKEGKTQALFNGIKISQNQKVNLSLY